MDGGAEVALFSHHGTAAWICTFVGSTETRHALIKSGDIFSGFVKGMKVGDSYGFRVGGPWSPDEGHRFDESKLLIDPYATRISAPWAYTPALSSRGVDTANLVPKSVLDAPLTDLPLHKTTTPRLIYELGVKSFTKLHPEIPAAQRGTVAALAHPTIIAHLKKLGVDTIELMPIHAWIDERHLGPLGLTNAWGYNDVQFMALDPRLAPGGWAELRDTVFVLHQNGIQVIMDVVFNHSGESDQFGPTISFRGLDNATYYAHNKGELHNDTGCGNTLDLNNPPVTEMVLASLRHAVLKCGVDGFRFDLATVLGRMEDGFHADAPLIRAISEDPVLSSRILIAEPWDVGPGGYRLGNFPAQWLEWNDQYRDSVRRFWRGDFWSANKMATRLCGSSDIFVGRKPSNSVNFIAAHDGFTLRDLTLYASKLNSANGEDNRDGNSAEVTWPSGNVEALLATLFLSRGTMMMTAGDEFGRTQSGNNNAYSQDNEITWLSWQNANQKLIDYVSKINGLREQYESFFQDQFIGANEALWFDETGKPLDWQRPENRFLGLMLKRGNESLVILLNASAQEISLALPEMKSTSWKLIFASSEGANCPPFSVCLYGGKST